MKRILHVINAMNVGGTETVIMNLYRSIDRSRYQFDFVVHVPDKGAYEGEIRELGGHVFRAEKYYVKNYLSYSRWWRGFLANHQEYGVVHCHQGSSAPVCLREANRAGRVSIAHSHNTRSPGVSLRSIAWEINSWPTRHVARHFLACSEEAGIDRFGERVVRSYRFHVMKNGIDISRFEFNGEVREEVRKSLGVRVDDFVVGHVGRFSAQKNHAILVDAFAEVARRRPESMLLLLGKGELEEKVRQRVACLGLGERVRFLGVRPNVEDYYCAMDAFCFPSLYEGLGMVTVEAQTSGLPVVASDALPSVADLGAGLFERLSPSDSAATWAEVLLSHVGEQRDARGACAARAAGYDISDVTEWLQEYYDRLLAYEE